MEKGHGDLGKPEGGGERGRGEDYLETLWKDGVA